MNNKKLGQFLTQKTNQAVKNDLKEKKNTTLADEAEEIKKELIKSGLTEDEAEEQIEERLMDRMINNK